VNGWWQAVVATSLVGVVVGALLNRSNEARRWKRETRLRRYARFHALARDLQRETNGFIRFSLAHPHGMGRESAEIAAEGLGRIRTLQAEVRDAASEAHLLAGERVLASMLTVYERLLRLFPVARSVPGEGSPSTTSSSSRRSLRPGGSSWTPPAPSWRWTCCRPPFASKSCSLTSTCHPPAAVAAA